LWDVVLKLPDWCWGSSIKRDAQLSTNRTNEMIDMPFRYAQQHMVGICYLSLVKDADCKPVEAEDTLLGRSSMVAENLQRMEKQDEASKPMFEDALKKAATTALVG
jgi:hypothetical protein